MAFLNQLFGKNNNFSAQYKRFKTAIQNNPRDHALKTQFINFCLLNRFANPKNQENHIVEALKMFETLSPDDVFDLQCHYLVGKYYQEEKEYRTAYGVYLDAIKLFNRNIGDQPNLKFDNAELAYSIALNLMTLQSDPVDPEIKQCFKTLKKSYPLHVKRIELENEMGKPAPDPMRIEQLTGEIRRLKADEDLITLVSTKGKTVEPSSSKPKEREVGVSTPAVGHIPETEKLSVSMKTDIQSLILPEEGKKEGFFKLSAASEHSDNGSAFMVYRNDNWEGPYTPSQLRSKGFLQPATWVCRSGSQHVIQAYEVPDLLPLN